MYREFRFINDGDSNRDVGVITNITARDEHVPEVERYIRMIKERTRGIYSALPYKHMPQCMVSDIVFSVVFWLNTFPWEDGISKTISPRTIVTGLTITYKTHCCIEFSAYAQIHVEHNNSLIGRTTGELALGPTGNTQGDHYFYSLVSGKCVAWNHWTVVPLSQDVINHVNRMGSRSNTPNSLTFGDRYGPTSSIMMM